MFDKAKMFRRIIWYVGYVMILIVAFIYGFIKKAFIEGKVYVNVENE